MKTFLFLIICLASINGCTSVALMEQPVVDYWNDLRTGSQILGKWVGAAPDGEQISYQFHRDHTCIWTYKEREIHCKYLATPHQKGIRVLIYEMERKQSVGVQFHSWVKIDKDKMMFYGFPTKYGRNQSGKKERWPDKFPRDSILLQNLSL